MHAYEESLPNATKTFAHGRKFCFFSARWKKFCSLKEILLKILPAELAKAEAIPRLLNVAYVVAEGALYSLVNDFHVKWI